MFICTMECADRDRMGVEMGVDNCHDIKSGWRTTLNQAPGQTTSSTTYLNIPD